MLLGIVILCLAASASAALSEDEPTQAVVGGRNANPGEFPHQVSLQSSRPFSHFCGGSLIHPQWVLTAAHCIFSSSITVKAGKYNIKSVESTEQSATVQKYFTHEYFQGRGVGPYDIALLKLSKPFQLNNYVKTIALPLPNSEPVGNAIVSGWGSVSSTSRPSMPAILQTAVLPLLNARYCKWTYAQYDPRAANYIHDSSNICTSVGGNRQSACSGDSGGPLIYNNPRGVTEVIGIVSWGSAICGSGTPSVYTKVSHLIHWIQATMAAN